MAAVCSRNFYPFYIVSYYIRWVQDFLDIKYMARYGWEISCKWPNDYQWTENELSDCVRVPYLVDLSLGVTDPHFFFKYGSEVKVYKQMDPMGVD